MVVSARNADPGGVVNAGAIYVWAGATTPSGTPTATLTVPGALPGDQLAAGGFRLADVTGDGVLDAEWFRYWMAIDPEILRAHLNHRNNDVQVEEEVLERLLVLFEEQTGLDAGEPGTEGPGLPEEFLAGVVGALHDVWRLVEDASDVKEG